MKPILVITMGDPNGVGPEICIKSVLEPACIKSCVPVIIGDSAVLALACSTLGISAPMTTITSLSEAHSIKSGIIVYCPEPFSGTVVPGKMCADAGRASLSYITTAVSLLKNREAVAMVTAPICKESINPTLPGFQGHTEYIGALCGDPHPVLTLIEENWVIAHVSTHVSLKEAIERVEHERIVKVGRLLNSVLKKLTGKASPSIGVAGLNPHAGEHGLFGSEEITIIEPAIRALKAEGIAAHGPLPADVVFPQMKAKTFDGVIAMYHDQGHIVTKTMSFSLGEKRKLKGVNATLGIDIVRTSVDHGTGFDIAWKGIADHGSMMDAIKCALTLSTK